MPTEEQYQSLFYWLGFDKLIILLFVVIILSTIALLVILPARYKKKEKKPQLYPKKYKEDD